MLLPMNSRSGISTRRNTSKLFVGKYFELLDWMKKYSNNNKQFDSFIMKNQMLKRANSSLFVKVWYEHVACKYYNQIMQDDFEYFLNNTFDDEISKTSFTEYNVRQAILHMKSMYSNLDESVIELFASRIKELTLLSYLYNKSQ